MSTPLISSSIIIPSYNLDYIKDPIARAKAEMYNQLIKAGKMSTTVHLNGSPNKSSYNSYYNFGDSCYNPDVSSTGSTMYRSTYSDGYKPDGFF